MSTLYAFLLSLMAGMSTLLGSLVIFFKLRNNSINKFITFCLSFSIAIMIGISITDLIPPSFYSIVFNCGFYIGIPIIIISFIIGFLIVRMINYLIKADNNSLHRLGILSMIALILHNFPEGIATFMGGVKSPTLGLKLSIAIMFHNIPEGISIAVPIYYATNSKKKAIFNTFISGLAEPLGAFLTYLLLKNYISDLLLCFVLLLVAGLMITLAINEILPKALSYNENKYIYLGLFVAILLIIISNYVI